MRKGSWIKIAISVIAIICNAGFLCWLIVEVFRNPPASSEVIIPAVLGLFFLLNLVAITFTLRGSYKTVQASSSMVRRFSKMRWIGLAIVVLGCIGLGFWIGFDFHDQIMLWKRERAKQAEFEKFVGKKAPDVIAQTLKGTEWRLQDQRGKVVVMDCWATWCGPCVAKIPEMKRIYKKYKSREDFVMVGISLDGERQTLAKFCEENEILWPQLFEIGKTWENSVAKAFEIHAIPSVWVIDKEGNTAGMNLYGDKVEQTIEKSLNQAQPTSDSQPKRGL